MMSLVRSSSSKDLICSNPRALRNTRRLYLEPFQSHAKPHIGNAEASRRRVTNQLVPGSAWSDGFGRFWAARLHEVMRITSEVMEIKANSTHTIELKSEGADDVSNPRSQLLWSLLQWLKHRGVWTQQTVPSFSSMSCAMTSQRYPGLSASKLRPERL